MAMDEQECQRDGQVQTRRSGRTVRSSAVTALGLLVGLLVGLVALSAWVELRGGAPGSTTLGWIGVLLPVVTGFVGTAVAGIYGRFPSGDGDPGDSAVEDAHTPPGPGPSARP